MIQEYTHRVLGHSLLHSTMVQNNQESRLKYWATRWTIPLSLRLYRSLNHLFCTAYFALLASIVHSAALTRLLARSLLRSWESYLLAIFAAFFSVLDHSTFVYWLAPLTHFLVPNFARFARVLAHSFAHFLVVKRNFVHNHFK